MAANKELTVPQRAFRFIYSTPNIAGSLLALCGVALFLAGFIQAYWWAIVAGLYATGVVGWPRPDPVPTYQQTRVSTELLAKQIYKLVDNVSGGLSHEAFDVLRSIQDTLNELLPRLVELEDNGVISHKDAFTVMETVRRYLPDTLIAYLRLPKIYAHKQTLADGRTASQALLEQLGMLNLALKDIARNALTEDGEMLVRNGRFLEAKFAERMTFRK